MTDVLELKPGQDPQRLKRPPSLAGARLRRALPLVKLTRSLQGRIRSASKATSRRALPKLGRSGLLAKLDRDAARRRKEQGKQGPIGRGGMPLGPEREQVIERIFAYDDMSAVARLFRDEEDAFRLELEAALKESYPEAFNAGGNAARRSLGVRGSFRLQNPAIADALFERANHLAADIAEDVFDRMKTVIADGFYLQGRGIGEIERALRDEFDWLGSARAERIARTETLSVTSEAQQTVYEASGVHFKRWITTLDGKERDSHFEAHGQVVPVDEPFEVGKSLLMYPGDPDGPPEEIINCRCDTQPIITADQVFSEADIWRGDVDPDEFAQDREAARDELTRGPSAPPASDTEDLQFADEEPPPEEKRLLVDADRVSPAVLRWWKAEREYERDTLGRFGTGGAATAEKPASALVPIPPKQEAKLLEHEDRILGNDFETGVAVDAAGNVLVDKVGDDNQVQFAKDEIERMRGSILTHNHPGMGTSFSVDDVRMASAAGLAEMRAVGGDGTRYRIQSERGGTWPGESRVGPAYREIYREVTDRWVGAMDRGEMNREQALRERNHEIWERISPGLGLIYERDESRRDPNYVSKD